MILYPNFPEGKLIRSLQRNGKEYKRRPAAANVSSSQEHCTKNADLILLRRNHFNELLDEASTISLLEHFRQLALAGKIIIMITHDKKSLSYCNKVIFIR